MILVNTDVSLSFFRVFFGCVVPCEVYVEIWVLSVNCVSCCMLYCCVFECV